jgi:CheY-like chemotaxis protein
MVRILVISSDAGNLAFYRNLLAREQFHVQTAATVEAGVQYLIAHHALHVVLIDVTMPADPLIGLLTLLAMMPKLRATNVYAGVGAIALQLRSEAISLMEVIGMDLIDLNEGSFPLSREITRLALRLQMAS